MIKLNDLFVFASFEEIRSVRFIANVKMMVLIHELVGLTWRKGKFRLR